MTDDTTGRGAIPGRFDDPELFINRELSWLEFNQRVLEEAEDPTSPLFERCKFLSIVASNLDEFFMVRVAGLEQQVRAGVDQRGPDNLSPSEALGLIADHAHAMIKEQYDCWNNEVRPMLDKEGIVFRTPAKLSKKQKNWLREYFDKEIYPVLTPMAIDPAHPFPKIANLTLHLMVILTNPGQLSHGRYYAIVPVPVGLKRLVELPRLKDEVREFMLLGDVIRCNLDKLFPGLKIESSSLFRVTRNFDLNLDEEEAEDLLDAIEHELRKLERGHAVRLEIERNCSSEAIDMLTRALEIAGGNVFRINGPINMTFLMEVWKLDGYEHLKDSPFNPVVPPRLQNLAHNNIFDIIRMGDILLHLPYDSFTPVVQMVQLAAEDPNVLAIKQTLYRTSSESPIIDALKRAAENGKQVTVLVELKARFDEDNNIGWARELEAAGVHVVYGLLGLKTHCKSLLIVRREEDGIRRYLHLATGNYNAITARIYTDIGIMTCDEDMADDVTALFNILTGFSEFPKWKKVDVAPNSLHSRINSLILREIDLHTKKNPGHIIAKLNSIVDETTIRNLYKASTAGVKIDLICRGICCLKPGLPGISENIHVRSIVGRYLEHSRIYYFKNGGDPEIFLSSADWMPRNFYRRIELLFPVEAPGLKKRLIDRILASNLEDNVKAREMKPDGTWVRASNNEPPFNCQVEFMKTAAKNAPLSELSLGRSARFILLQEERDDFGRIVSKHRAK